MFVVNKMPEVSECLVDQCTSNINGNCHAKAITVGDFAHAQCDTFFVSKVHYHDVSFHAGICACKVPA